MSGMPATPLSQRADRLLDRLAGYSWRLLVIGAATIAALWLARALSPVLIPAVIALFLARLLTPIAETLRRRFRPGIAAAVALITGLVILISAAALIVPAISDELTSLDRTVTSALDEIEDWLVVESPFDVSRDAIDELRSRAARAIDDLVHASSGQVVDGATLVAEILAGLFLAVLFTFFVLRDGARFAAWLHERVPSARREPASRAAARGWFVLGRYLRGAAILGAVESLAIGISLFVSGGRLVLPVMLLTFVAAFVPIVGAVVAGVTAVLVGLVTGGVATAAIVAIVAIVVQQLDNDVLGPWIYGRALALHPVVVLVSVVAGGALFGIAGTLLAVPTVAVAVNVAKELARPEQPVPPPS